MDAARLVALGWANGAGTNDPIDADGLSMRSASVAMPGSREAHVGPIRLPATSPGLPHRSADPTDIDRDCGPEVHGCRRLEVLP